MLFTVNFEHIHHIVPVFFIMTLRLRNCYHQFHITSVKLSATQKILFTYKKGISTKRNPIRDEDEKYLTVTNFFSSLKKQKLNCGPYGLMG